MTEREIGISEKDTAYEALLSQDGDVLEKGRQ